MDYFIFPPFLFFVHLTFRFWTTKKDTKNLLLIFDVFLLIKGLRLNVAPGTAYPEQKTLLRGKPCIKIIHLYGNTIYCIRQQNTANGILYLVVLSFFKYAYHFYFYAISTSIRKISKASYIGIYYEKQDSIRE